MNTLTYILLGWVILDILLDTIIFTILICKGWKTIVYLSNCLRNALRGW